MNTLYKNSLLYLLATLSVKAASFILLPFYSYLISPAEYGYIYIVVSFVSFMSIMMTFSVSASISRFYIDCEGIVEVRKMFSTIVYTVVGCSLIIGSSLLYFHEEIAFWLNIPSLYLIIAIISSIFILLLFADYKPSLHSSRGKKNIVDKYGYGNLANCYSVEYGVVYE